MSDAVEREVDALIVGAGMGGILTLRKLTRDHGLDAVLIDKASGVGGTWFWNRYPGAISDTESQLYKLPNEPELFRASVWRTRYATATEIRQHLDDAVDMWGLRPRVLLETALESAAFDEETGTWRVVTSGGVFRARFLVTALGLLSAINVPKFPGIENFAGRIVHTADYPADLDLSGLKVGVIGNGSTGIQFMTEIAPRVGKLVSFQRTPQYSVPARNREYTDEELHQFDENCEAMWAETRTSKVGFGLDEVERSTFSVSAEEREAIFEQAWERGNNMAFLYETFNDLATDRAANDEVSSFIKRKITEIVKDPDTAAKLLPTEPYARRPICDSGYYEIFNRDNVELVTIRDNPIVEFTAAGPRTADGEVHEIDVLVMATGFDAVDGNYMRTDIRGLGGRELKEHWANGPRSRFGISVSGFPNMFMVLGPNGPFVNLPIAIGVQTDWIAEVAGEIASTPGAWWDLTPEAEQEWLDEAKAALEGSLFLETQSWIFGANIPGKRKPDTVNFYTSGLKTYLERLGAETASGYANYRSNAAIEVAH